MPGKEERAGATVRRGAPAGELVVALAGEGAAAVRALRLVEERGHRIACVLTSDRAGAAGGSLGEVAETAGHRVLPAATVRDPSFAAELQLASVDLLLTVHSLHVVTPQVLEAPRVGCFNLHPGPLPEYAGLDTVSWALYRGEAEFGVTLHEMVPRIDAGRIAFRASFPVTPDDTAFRVFARCADQGCTLVDRLLEAASRDGEVSLEPQDLTRRRVHRRGPPGGGRVDWGRTAGQVRDFVRACDYGPFVSPWGHPRTLLGERELELLAVSLTGEDADRPPGAVRHRTGADPEVACADQWLRIEAVRVDGERSRAGDALSDGACLS
jgi:methionyl-tRNA formyltransferase